MPIRVLIAPDKFKGTLSAVAAARAIARGWRQARPADALDLFPISDGGDGFGEVLGEMLGAGAQSVSTLNAAHEPCTTQWWWEATTRTAIIESARVVGLAMLPPGKFHPFELDTFGLGAVLQAAAQHGARRCVIGVGGSATNDGGFGLAKALDWQFLDRQGRPLESWAKLRKLARLVPPGRTRMFPSLVVAVDVRNPLLGPDGATRVYGPQKGIQRWDVAPAERCLRRLAHIARASTRQDFAPRPGAGAAGGLGFGLAVFLGARLTPGFDLIARHGALATRMARADLVITGEGAIDRSTFMGKGAGRIAELCHRRKIPCIALAGVVARSTPLSRWFAQRHALTELTSPDEAKANAAQWLEQLAERTAWAWQEPGGE